MPKVYNSHHRNSPPGAVYIGRGTFMGNPFLIGRDGTRDDVCDKYEAMVESRPELKAIIIEFCRGKDLVCFCAPARCHGDYILRIANEDQGS